jgi:hypothetical protein
MSHLAGKIANFDPQKATLKKKKFRLREENLYVKVGPSQKLS